MNYIKPLCMVIVWNDNIFGIRVASILFLIMMSKLDNDKCKISMRFFDSLDFISRGIGKSIYLRTFILSYSIFSN